MRGWGKILILFGVLDLIALLRASPLLVRLPPAVFASDVPMRTAVLHSLYIVLCISYAFSAYGFIRRKPWACVTYYFQLPLRLGFFSLSLGFLALINKPFQSLPLHFVLAGIILVAELTRLVVTIVIHKRSNKRLEGIA